MSILINYIREKNSFDVHEGFKGTPVGIVVALDKEHIGWSLCSPRDKWNKKLGLTIAENRAKLGRDIESVCTKACARTFDKIYKPLKFMKEKAQRYFKKK